MYQSSRPGSGFTLVELIVVLAIVSVLATIGLPLAELAKRRAQEEELRVALRQIRDGLDAYKKAVDTGRLLRIAGESGYPQRLEQLVEGVTDIADPNRGRIYFLRRIPRDPFAPEELPASQTWALRSYESDPADPKPGRDVFDVHSRADAVGSNGIPYSKW